MNKIQIDSNKYENLTGPPCSAQRTLDRYFYLIGICFRKIGASSINSISYNFAIFLYI